MRRQAIRHESLDQAPESGGQNGPAVIPEIELRGSPAERLRVIDAAIARLRELRRALAGVDDHLPYEVYGPYINAPVWPWTVAGWSLAAIFMLLFVITWLRS